MNDVEDVKKDPLQIKTNPVKNSKTPIVSDEEREYGKLAIVISVIFFISVITFLVFDGKGPFKSMMPVRSFTAQFMGVFFIVFAGFKFISLKNFARGFTSYDVIAKRWKTYSVSYPFLQLAVGISMFTFPQYWFTHFIALLISGVALIGVISPLLERNKIQKVPRGKMIKMPVSTLIAIENGSMFVIAGLMVIAMV